MRTTIYLDEALSTRLRRFVPRRGLSRFINEAVRERVTALEGREIEHEMREGYVVTRQEREELNRDWEFLDSASWPE